jgi:hypothetical protein
MQDTSHTNYLSTLLPGLQVINFRDLSSKNGGFKPSTITAANNTVNSAVTPHLLHKAIHTMYSRRGLMEDSNMSD